MFRLVSLSYIHPETIRKQQTQKSKQKYPNSMVPSACKSFTTGPFKRFQAGTLKHSDTLDMDVSIFMPFRAVFFFLFLAGRTRIRHPLFPVLKIPRTLLPTSLLRFDIPPTLTFFLFLLLLLSASALKCVAFSGMRLDCRRVTIACLETFVKTASRHETLV